MKPSSFALVAALLALSSPALAQAPAHATAGAVEKSDARKGFDQLKTLAGSWVGQITTFPEEPSVKGKLVQFSLRVSSRGNALVHEMAVSGLPDHPVTMFFVDEDRLLLTHYCDAGNRPRMSGKVSPDGKTLEFTFVDLSGGNEHGHMDHAVFTFIDPDHHTEDWTFVGPRGGPLRAHFELQRTNFGSGPATP